MLINIWTHSTVNVKGDKNKYIAPSFPCIQHNIRNYPNLVISCYTNFYLKNCICLCHLLEAREQKDFVPLIQEMLFCPFCFQQSIPLFCFRQCSYEKCSQINSCSLPYSVVSHSTSFIQKVHFQKLYWWVQPDLPPRILCKGNESMEVFLKDRFAFSIIYSRLTISWWTDLRFFIYSNLSYFKCSERTCHTPGIVLLHNAGGGCIFEDLCNKNSLNLESSYAKKKARLESCSLIS